MIFWGLKSCDSCRKALKELAAAGHEPEVRDVRADGLPEDLDLWLDRLGAEALVNRRSTTWRGLEEADRQAFDDPVRLVALLRRHPTLAKRPLIRDGDQLSAGWAPDVRSRFV